MMRLSWDALPPEIRGYVQMVRLGEPRVCKEQAQLISLLENVVRKEELYLDDKYLARAMGWQKYFPYKLFPWEKFVFALHNCVFGADGEPRFPDLFVLCGRGAGKNGYLSFEAFCQLSCGIQEYDVDICATSEDQAKTSFDELYGVLENPKYEAKFRKHFDWNKTRIMSLDTRSTLKYRTNNAKGKDGLRSGSVFFDEVHAYESWENINVFTTGLGKKPCPRRTYVTTNGDVRDGVLDKMIGRAIDILSEREGDGGMLPFICKLDDAKEVNDEKNWYKANPSLQYFPSLLREIRKEYEEYKLDPLVNTAFLTKRMNIPQTRKDIAVTDWENILRTNRPMPNLAGQRCVCGIDYAKTNDFVAVVLLFMADDIYYVLHHSWVCTRSCDLRQVKFPLGEMADRGILSFVDDAEIPPSAVSEWIGRQQAIYRIDKAAIDSYRYALMARALRDVGYEHGRKNLWLVRPSDVVKAQPIINSAFATGRIVWGDDPMMRWYTNNAKLVPAANNNWTFGKIDPHRRKTDGFMALVSAMALEQELHEGEAHQVAMPFIF